MGVLDQIGSSARSFKFEQIGDRVLGTIAEEPELVQRRDYKTGEPEFWSDGKPVNQVRVILAGTGERDTADDDGSRAVYIKAWGDQLAEVRKTVKAAGDTDLHVGARFGVLFSGYGQAQGGGQPAKVYSYFYEKPAVLPGGGMDGWDQPAPPPSPAPAPAQARRPPAAAPAPGWDQPAPAAAPAAAPAPDRWSAGPAPTATGAAQDPWSVYRGDNNPPADPPASAGLNPTQVAAYRAAMAEQRQQAPS